MATPRQIKLIHCVKNALGMSDEDYRAVLAEYGVDSSKKLNSVDAARLQRDLEDKAIAAGKWKRGKSPKRTGKKPENMNHTKDMDLGRLSRARQLAKIEALLTVGKKPWSYADALAEKMCRTDDGVPIKRVAFVDSSQLGRIIGALRKQAIREGWDLSGE